MEKRWETKCFRSATQMWFSRAGIDPLCGFLFLVLARVEVEREVLPNQEMDRGENPPPWPKITSFPHQLFSSRTIDWNSISEARFDCSVEPNAQGKCRKRRCRMENGNHLRSNRSTEKKRWQSVNDPFFTPRSQPCVDSDGDHTWLFFGRVDVDSTLHGGWFDGIDLPIAVKGDAEDFMECNWK